MTAPNPDDQRERAETMAWLRFLGDEKAGDLIEQAIGDAIQQRELDAVPGLLALMCSFDPHRAERLHRTLLDATRGRITITLDGLT